MLQRSPLCPGLGQLNRLSDELLLRVLSQLTANSLGRLSACCKGLYCFANHEDLWRTLVLEVRPNACALPCPQCHRLSALTI